MLDISLEPEYESMIDSPTRLVTLNCRGAVYAGTSFVTVLGSPDDSAGLVDLATAVSTAFNFPGAWRGKHRGALP